jgi:hypothetical protein
MRSDPNLGKLSEDDITALAGFSPDQINAGGKFLETMAKNAGFETYDEFKEKMTGAGGVKSFGATSSPATAQRQKALAKIQSELGFNPLNNEMFNKKIKEAGSKEEKERLTSLRDEALDLGQAIGSNLIATGKIPQGTNPNDIMSHVSQVVGLEVKDNLKGTGIAAPTVPQGALVDTDKTSAMASQKELTEAMEFMPRYAKSVKDIASISEELATALSKMINLTKGIGLQEQQDTGRLIVSPSNSGLDWFTGKK